MEKKEFQDQRNRLDEVLKELKKRGIKQRELCEKANLDYSAISHYKSGKIKYIPDKFLETLYKYYGVNPAYIRLESKEMFDDKGEKYSHFEKVVEEWETVKSKDDKYLYLKMDKNFYDFLIEYDRYRKVAGEGISTEDKIADLKTLYEGDPDIEEFVVLPRNIFFEIVGDTKKAEKSLEEIVDFSEHTALLDEK